MAIRISPPNPTTDDAVIISAEFSSCTAPPSIVQSGFTFTVLFLPFIGCGGNPQVVVKDFPVGKLPAGGYLVTPNATTVGPGLGAAPVTFAVSVAVSPASAVPALEPFGAVLIAAAILMIAATRFRRR